MNNELFDAPSLAVILNQTNWRIVSSLFDEEVDFVHQPTHLKWLRNHTESHPAREILFSLKGNGVYGYKGKIYPCQPGSVFLFNSYESHDNYYPASCPEMLHLWLSLFEHDVVAKILLTREGKIHNLVSSLVLSGDPAACLLTSTWDKLANATSHARVRRAQLLAALASLLLRIVEYGYENSDGHAESNFQSQVIKTIRHHVAKTAGRDVPLSEAARLAGYSKHHFLKLFKRETGQTFHEYVNECRLKKVSAMLQERRTKTEISETLGFTHPSTFLRWMKTQNLRGVAGSYQ